MIWTGGVGEAFHLAHSFRQHRRVVLFADDPVVPMVSLQQRRCKATKPKATTTLPLSAISNPPWVLTIYHLEQTWNDVGVAVFAKLNHDPMPTHLMSHRACCPAARERI